MKRQTLVFKKEYNKYSFIQEISNLWNIFADEEVQENSKDILLFHTSESIIKNMELGLKNNFNYSFNDEDTPKYDSIISDKFILCCFSGGKDSLATALYYKEQGYDVHLYTVKGINVGYPDEYKAAINLAEKMNLPIYIEEIKLNGKKFYIEHPLKNQIIASCAVAYCLENNLPVNISFGNYQEDTYDKSNWGVNWTDNYTLWQEYSKFITSFVPNATINIPFYNETNAYTYLDNNFELMQSVQSCLSALRHRSYLHDHNEEKYKIKLMPNRCGSCVKCCIEYIHFCDVGKVEYDQEFYKHCLDILKKKYQEYLSKDTTPRDLKIIYKEYFPDGKSRYFDK